MVELKTNNIYHGLKDIYIRKNKNVLKIFYGGNGDLYFDIFGEHTIDSNGIYSAAICISQSDELYSDFEELFTNILNCNLVGADKNYDSLINDGVINWYSDEIYDEKANLLKISKTGNGIVLTFFDNPDDPTFGFGIRISNSGSKYDPFNIFFVDFFNKIQENYKSHNDDLIRQLIP